MPRKIIQIAFKVSGWIGDQNDGYGSDNYTGGVTESHIVALCDDLTLWQLNKESVRAWERIYLPEIPQGD